MVAVSHEHTAAPDAVARSPAKLAESSAQSAERLIDLQLGFNLFPALYAHPSWLVRLGCRDADGSQGVNLTSSPMWVRALSVALMRGEELDRHFDCDFFDPAKRLALLDATTLIRVAGLVSATLLRERLRRVVRSDEVQVLHACIGTEAHQFAVRWSGALPFINPVLDGSTWPSRDVWTRKSVAQLVSVVPVHAIGVLGRLRLRFPCDWKLPDSQQSRLTEPQRVSLTRLIVAVILEIVPQWSWLFALSAPLPLPRTRGVA